jgi:hypothetical protein
MKKLRNFLPLSLSSLLVSLTFFDVGLQTSPDLLVARYQLSLVRFLAFGGLNLALLLYVDRKNRLFGPKLLIILAWYGLSYAYFAPQEMRLSADALTCGGQTVALADVQSVTIGRSGRANSGFLELTGDQGRRRVDLSDICTSNLDRIAAAFASHDIPVIRE